jgi:hypothetical protein
MKLPKHVREFLDMAKVEGVVDAKIACSRRCHYKFTGRLNGKSVLIYMASTPGCKRNNLNNLSILRRTAR